MHLSLDPPCKVAPPLGKKQFCSRASTSGAAIITSIAFPVNFAGRVLRHDTAAFLRLTSAAGQILSLVSSRCVTVNSESLPDVDFSSTTRVCRRDSERAPTRVASGAPAAERATAAASRGRAGAWDEGGRGSGGGGGDVSRMSLSKWSRNPFKRHCVD
jgi:hypothetical protein